MPGCTTKEVLGCVPPMGKLAPTWDLDPVPGSVDQETPTHKPRACTTPTPVNLNLHTSVSVPPLPSHPPHLGGSLSSFEKQQS